MRNPKIKFIKPNYKKRVLEIILTEKNSSKKYYLPFAIFRQHHISTKNKFKKIDISPELNCQGASFILEDDSEGDFSADLVLYYCDPTYDWSPLNQIRKTIREKLKSSHLSFRVLAEILNTSPAQIIRLLRKKTTTKELAQLIQLAELIDYELDIRLKKKSAA